MSRCLYQTIRSNLYSTLKTHSKYKYLGANKEASIILQNHHLDTSIWSDIEIVDTDIFLVSSATSGSTWMYQVIANLLYQNNTQSWIDLCLSPTFSSFRIGGATEDAKVATLETIHNQLMNTDIKHRIFKLHEPIESMPFNPNCKYIFVSRDFRDIIWSFYAHYRTYSDSIMQQINSKRYNYELIRKLPYFDDLNKHNDFEEIDFWRMSIRTEDDFGNPDGFPFWSQLWLIGSWLNVYFDENNKYNNIKIVHYNEMVNDLAKVVKDIAQFLNVEMDENQLNELINNCSLDTMKAKQHQLFGETGKLWWKEPKEFFYTGRNNRWHNILTQSDIDEYRMLSQRYLTQKQLNWLEAIVPSTDL